MNNEDKGFSPDDEASASPSKEPTTPTLPGFGFLARALADEIADHSLKVGARVGSIRVESLLGEGGMGTVWQGLDESLARPVAVKSLRGLTLSSSAKERLRREARLLARLDHPRICRIHELIETEEGDYLVLELVHGRSLGDVARRGLEADRALALAEGIADALAAAHDERVIHRDLKPDNVMVTPSGEVKVLDFGISRSLGETDLTAASQLDGNEDEAGQEFRLTVTGRLLGTPRYMSPEQARGEEATEASDVFSFGLLLQELLTGRPAFDGGTASVVLEKIVTGDREALPAATDPEVASLITELTAVESELRPTAREALDRLRWIRDRPARRRRRRVRIAVTTVLIAALTAALVASAQAWRTGRRAELQAVAARELGEEVQAVETLLRLGHLAPLHDVGRERGQAEERLRKLEARGADQGPWAQGPLAYARGRIELALGRAADARNALEEAWKLGYQRPEVAEALGEAFGSLYDAAVDEAYLLGSLSQRQAALGRAAEEFREPAALWLRRGAASNLGRLAEARVALYEERFTAAAEIGQAVAAEMPWLYEAYEIAARALLARGRAALARGDRESGRADMDAADAALEAGSIIGRSHPGLRLERCILGGLRIKQLESNVNPEILHRSVVPACEEARTLLPTSAEPLLARSSLELAATWKMENSLRDPEPWVSRLEEAARAALDLDPKAAKAFYYLGRASDHRGDHAASMGKPYIEHQRRAVESFRQATALEPDSAAAQYGLGLGLFNVGYWAVAEGEDPEEELQEAIRAFEAAHRLEPTVMDSVAMTGVVHGVLALAALERGRDPTLHLERSIAAYSDAIQMQPTNLSPWVNRAMARRDQATFRWLVGKSVAEEVERGKDDLAKVFELDPAVPSIYLTLVELELLAGRSAMESGGDPSESVEAAFRNLAELVKLDLEHVDGSYFAVQAHLLAADGALAQGKSPDDHLIAAERVLPRLKRPASAAELRAEVALRRAFWRRHEGHKAGAEVRSGLREVAQALEKRPKDGDLWLLKGRLERLVDPEVAQESLARALELNPWLQRQVADVRASLPP